MKKSHKKWAFLLLTLALVSCDEPKKLDPLELGNLALVDTNQLEQAIATYKNSPRSDEDKYNLGYSLIAFSFTPAGGKSPKTNESHSNVRGFFGTIRNFSEQVKEKARDQKDFASEKPLREKAREKGIKYWTEVAESGHLQAQVGLAWYYGKIDDKFNGYVWRQVAFINGDMVSEGYAKAYARALSDDAITKAREKAEAFTVISARHFKVTDITKTITPLTWDGTGLVCIRDNVKWPETKNFSYYASSKYFGFWKTGQDFYHLRFYQDNDTILSHWSSKATLSQFTQTYSDGSNRINRKTLAYSYEPDGFAKSAMEEDDPDYNGYTAKCRSTQNKTEFIVEILSIRHELQSQLKTIIKDNKI
ncbi:hypothetical protein N8524_06380 [Candidatus Puniceispirillum sp.]|nr:hypothetical protein [Candidatus Puniceispirillum sp.]